MDQIMITTIELVVLVIAFLIGKYAIPFIRTNLDASKLGLISSWALMFVRASENIIVGSGKGEEKRKQVTAWIKEKADEIGINLTEDQIRTLLEDAYTTMIQEANKNNAK